MSKLSVLMALLTRPKEVISLGYQAMVRNDNTTDYEQYVIEKYGSNALPTIDLLDLLPGFDESISHYSYLTDTSTVPDILMLKGLARKFNNCAYLEIGSFRGESIACVADVVEDCTSITLSEQEMRDFNLDAGYIRNHDIFSKHKTNIKSILHNSLTYDFSKLNGKKFDLIFVDGDHRSFAVKKDTENVFKLLKDENSVIVWHDYGYDVEKVRYDVFAGILDGTPEGLHNNLFHVSNTMCAIFTRQKYPAKVQGLMADPNKVFSVHVKASRL